MGITKDGKVVSHIYKPKIIANAYEVLEYIESSGLEKIDTGIGCNLIKSIDTRFAISTLPPSSKTSMLYGYYGGTYKGCNYLQYGSATAYIYGNAGNHAFSPAQRFTVNKKYRLTCPITSAGKAILYDEDDIKLGETSLTANRETGNMTIFVIGGSATVQSHYSKAKIYSFKMYGLDDELLADYVPVKRLADDVIGLFDTITNTFYENCGTGSFIGKRVEVKKIKNITTGKEIILVE